MFTIREFCAEQFEDIKIYWKQLEKGQEMTAYQMYEWYENLNRNYLKEKAKNVFRKWVYLVVFDQDVPVLIAPYEIWKAGIGYKQFGIKKGCYFIGRRGYSDYLNFIYDEYCSDAIDYTFEYVNEHYKCQYFMLDYIPQDSSVYNFIKNNENVSEIEHCEKSLKLPVDFETYKKSLSKHARQNIRTAINRQKKDGINLEYDLIYELDKNIRYSLIEIRNKRLKDKQLKDKQKSSFKGKLYNNLLSLYDKIFSVPFEPININGNTWCFLVKDKEKIAAFYFGIRNLYKNEYCVIWAGVDPDYSWYSPAVSQFYSFIEKYYSDERKDISVFDFTRGSEKYKTDIGCTDHPSSSLSFYIKKQTKSKEL